MMNFEWQPSLENELVRLQPLKETDFESLYAIASDPLLWEQHPNKDRYLRPVFDMFFKGAMESGGAFLLFNKESGRVIGTSRYYGFDQEAGSVVIGYTFIARDHWGKGYNQALKKCMLHHAFRFCSRVIFHIGATNVRSQKAIGNMGAVKIGEVEMEYYGEAKKLNFIYEIQNTLKGSK